MAEVITSRESGYFQPEEHSIQKLFEIVIRATLAGIQPRIHSRDEHQARMNNTELIEFNSRELISNKTVIQAYMVFPLLEAILKKTCMNFVDYSGKVISKFSVTRKDGSKLNYVVSGQGRKSCSSLRDLLFLLYNDVADADLKAQIDLFRHKITNLNNSDDPFDLIYKWRNSALHGDTSYPTIGGTLLNLTILIIISEIRVNFELIRSKVWERVQWELNTSSYSSHRSPWSFYPPVFD